MIKIPTEGKWLQSNRSDRKGSISRSRNINLDKEGYLKLSPRSVLLFDDRTDTTNVADQDFNFPVAFGRYDVGDFRIATTDEPFNLSISNTTKSIAEDTDSNNPNLTFNSHGVWFQNRWYTSLDTSISYNDSGTWTAGVITGLTSGIRHYMTVFKNKRALAVSNGNTVKLYDTSHALLSTLTLPPDYEIIGIAYNNYTLGIITRLGGDTEGQNSECFFFVWNGSNAEASTGVGMGSYTSFCLFPYQSSFAIINSSGQLLKWNGGGFDILDNFPFYLEENRWGDLLNHLSYGDNIVVDGETILINIGFDLDGVSKKEERYLPNNPSGVWCYDPSPGLYHRTSPSISRSYVKSITDPSVDLTTNIFTATGTIPATGNPAMLTNGSVGGLSYRTVYWIIKLSSTTFQLASTKDLAMNGVAMDITSVSSFINIWMYDLLDFGATYTEKTGAIALYDSSSRAFKDYLFGGRYLDETLNTFIGLCSNVPTLENRGYFVTPRIFTDSKVENIDKYIIKHRPLDVEDKIIVKVKKRQILELPTISPNAANDDESIWSSSTECYTSTDLSEAKAYLDTATAGNELEMELIAGVGAGQMVKVSEISFGGGVYSIVLAESVIGASPGMKSYFVIENWTKISEANYLNQDPDGVFSFQIAANSKAIEVKVELRGYDVTIEDTNLINRTHKPSV